MYAPLRQIQDIPFTVTRVCTSQAMATAATAVLRSLSIMQNNVDHAGRLASYVHPPSAGS